MAKQRLLKAKVKLSKRTYRKLILLLCDRATIVLPVFERMYPTDKNPRNAIDAARAWVKGKCIGDLQLTARRALRSGNNASDDYSNAVYTTKRKSIGAAYAAYAAYGCVNAIYNDPIEIICYENAWNAKPTAFEYEHYISGGSVVAYLKQFGIYVPSGIEKIKYVRI